MRGVERHHAPAGLESREQDGVEVRGPAHVHADTVALRHPLAGEKTCHAIGPPVELVVRDALRAVRHSHGLSVVPHRFFEQSGKDKRGLVNKGEELFSVIADLLGVLSEGMASAISPGRTAGNREPGHSTLQHVAENMVSTWKPMLITERYRSQTPLVRGRLVGYQGRSRTPAEGEKETGEASLTRCGPGRCDCSRTEVASSFGALRSAGPDRSMDSGTPGSDSHAPDDVLRATIFRGRPRPRVWPRVRPGRGTTSDLWPVRRHGGSRGARPDGVRGLPPCHRRGPLIVWNVPHR